MAGSRTVIEKVPWWNARLYIGLLTAMSVAAVWTCLNDWRHPLGYFLGYSGFLFVGVIAGAVLFPVMTIAALYKVTLGGRIILYTQDGYLIYLFPVVSKTALDQIAGFDLQIIRRWVSEKECIAVHVRGKPTKYIDVGLLENKNETLERLKNLIRKSG